MRRKFWGAILILAAAALTLNCQTKATDEQAKACKYLSPDEAAKILGRPVELITNSWTFTQAITRFDCVYRGIEKDGGRAIKLFFTLEESASEAEARQIYEAVWRSNKDHEGIGILSGVGDEAYRHGDPPNFYFIMARRRNFTIRLKINRADETASPEKLTAFAKKVAGRI